VNTALQPYPWHRAAWDSLVELSRVGRLPHALMLLGPGETGKQHLALSFAQRLFCSVPGEHSACGQCRGCQLFTAGSHPDFLLLEPEEAGKVIKVDDIRAAGEFAGKTASQGGWRVLVLSPAEGMNVSAANAFLKTLEEPGERVLIVLISHQGGAVLPTIRSRCRIMTLSEPPLGLARDWLAARASQGAEVERALQQAGGRPLRALRFLDGELRAQLERFEAALEALEAGAASALESARAVQDIPGRELVDWLQRRVYEHLRAPALVGSPRARPFFRFLDRLVAVRQRITGTANPNAQLLWEEVLMDWKAVLDFDLRHRAQERRA